MSQKHRLSDVNPKSRTAVCEKCGPVRIKRKNRGKGRGYGWRCHEATRKWQVNNWGRWPKEALAQRQALLERQGQWCAICGEWMAEPHMDHCHQTGVIRGLLCRSCNVGLGHYRDQPALLRRAAFYLENAKGGFWPEPFDEDLDWN